MEYKNHYLNVLYKHLRDGEIKLDSDIDKFKPYHDTHIFDIDKTIRENRELVKIKNKEINMLNQKRKVKVAEHREMLIQQIKYTLLMNNNKLNEAEVENLINYALDKLGKNERKLKKWANVRKLLYEIDELLVLLDAILVGVWKAPHWDYTIGGKIW